MVDEASRTWAGDMATAYDELLAPAVFRPYAEDLARRVHDRSPRVVLELAAGTGVLTEAVRARLPEVEVIATDLNTAMVEVGRTNVPSVTWRQADAQQLPFGDGSVDLVACQFGVMFFPDRRAAYTEVARVLRPGGHFLLSCWGPLAEHEVEAAITEALAVCFPDDPPDFLARVPHGYHDAARVEADLKAAGLTTLAVEKVELICTARTAADLARGYGWGTPLRAEIAARGDLDATVRALTSALEDRFGSGPVAGRMSALVASAVAPVSRS